MDKLQPVPMISSIRHGAPNRHDGQPECSTNELAHSNPEASSVARLLPNSESSAPAASTDSTPEWDFRIQADGFPE